MEVPTLAPLQSNSILEKVTAGVLRKRILEKYPWGLSRQDAEDLKFRISSIASASFYLEHYEDLMTERVKKLLNKQLE